MIPGTQERRCDTSLVVIASHDGKLHVHRRLQGTNGVVPGVGDCCDDAAGVGLLHGEADDPVTEVAGGVPVCRVAEQPAEQD